MLPMLFTNANQIQSLIDNAVSESKTLEYKAALPGTTREERIEFLADVTALSNTSGGSILYGINAENGIAHEVIGIENRELDDAILRLENMIRDGVRPRIVSLQIVSIALNQARSVLALSVPKSFSSPHVVDLQGHWRLYGRNSAGKYQLDIDELRVAFDAALNHRTRIRDFRAQRLLDIKSNNTPLRLQGNGRIVVHLIPMSPTDTADAINLSELVRDNIWIRRNLAPINDEITGHRFNLDGYLTFCHAQDPAFIKSYVQVFRNGTIEAVDSSLLRIIDGSPSLPAIAYETKLRTAIPRYLQFLNHVGINLPIVYAMSIVNVRGYTMAINPRVMFDRNLQINHLDRDDLVIPESLIDSFDSSADQVLRPAFDAIWNAFGYERSFNYDEEGQWAI